jgi:hypothetical protein
VTVAIRVVAGAAACVAVVLALAGCAPSKVNGDPSPSGSATSSADSGAWAGVDPCKLLTDQELQQNGVKTDSTPLNENGETGCDFLNATDVVGRAINLTKSPQSADSYAARSSDFVSFKKNSVNSRSGFQTQIGSTNDECSQYMAVGTGVVSVAVTRDNSGDPCGDALKLAQLAEPRLPK